MRIIPKLPQRKVDELKVPYRPKPRRSVLIASTAVIQAAERAELIHLLVALCVLEWIKWTTRPNRILDIHPL
mgnify:CR=1 FL=1